MTKENSFSFFRKKEFFNEPIDFSEKDQSILKARGYDIFRLPKKSVLKMIRDSRNVCVSSGQEQWLRWIYEDSLYQNSTPLDVAINPNQFILSPTKGYKYQDKLHIMKNCFQEEFGANNNFEPTLLTMSNYLALLVGYFQKENKLLIPYDHIILTSTKKPDGRNIIINNPYNQIRIDIESSIDSEKITLAPCIVPTSKKFVVIP